MKRAAPRLLIAGESFEDLIFAGLPRLPGPGEEIRTGQFRRTLGGGALISAAWARSEGIDVELLSALPPRAGRTLQAEGIRCRNLRKTGEPHAVTACLSFGAERSFATYPGCNPDLEPRLRQVLVDGLETPSFQAALFAMTPGACGVWADWQAGLHRPPGVDAEVFWDFGYDERLPRREGFAELLRTATGVFVNVQEAMLYNGRNGLLQRAVDAGALVVVKLGEAGAEVFAQPETRVPAPIPLRGVRDTTGAGDAFAAGFLGSRLRGGTLAEQLAAGNVCGARSVQHLGGLPNRPWAPRH